MAAVNRAVTIPIKDLSAAVKAAVDKTKAPVQPQFVFNPNIIIGRILREQLDLAGAQKVANEITHAVGAAHAATGAGTPHTLTPTVLWQNNHIICGFIQHEMQVFSAE